MVRQTSLYQLKQRNGVVFVILVRDTWNNITRGPVAAYSGILLWLFVLPQDQDTAQSDPLQESSSSVIVSTDGGQSTIPFMFFAC